MRVRLHAAASLVAILVAAPAGAQTCDYIAKPAAEAALAYLPEGAVVQAYCAPCRDRQARRIVVEEAEIQVVDTIYVHVLINGRPVDPAYLYVVDPRGKRWSNLGLLVSCHEEDDVPPTLPGDKIAR